MRSGISLGFWFAFPVKMTDDWHLFPFPGFLPLSPDLSFKEVKGATNKTQELLAAMFSAVGKSQRVAREEAGCRLEREERRNGKSGKSNSLS